MKKILLLLVILSAAAFNSFAQSSSGSSKFSIGLDLAVPSGNASNVYTFGIGGSLKFETPVASNLSFTLGAGYESFMVKSALKNAGFESSDGFIPVKAGLKYYFDSPGEGFYGEAQAGATFLTGNGNSGTAFAYSPGIGYAFSGGFDAGLRYEAWSKNGTIGQFALRLAYNF